MTGESDTNLGIVVIGRNEGERLRRCLASLAGITLPVIYVDSGSDDDSVACARRSGAEILELSGAIPFTAARARNEGLRLLRKLHPEIELVQFVDGDCQLCTKWVASALSYLEQNPQCAAVCGRLREVDPESSIYNRLYDMEWDGPIGTIQSCGGITMMRADVLDSLQGFNEQLIAGEEPELCLRLRQHGWTIVRLPVEMARHDGAMTRFEDWFRRSVRAGFAFAQGAALHGATPERYGVRQVRSALLWGLLLPSLTAALTAVIGPPALAILLLYPLQWFRLSIRQNRRLSDNLLRGGFLVLGKFAEMFGILWFAWGRSRHQAPRLIEFK